MKKIAKALKSEYSVDVEILLAGKTVDGYVVLLVSLPGSFLVVSHGTGEASLGFFNRRPFDVLMDAKANFTSRFSATNLN